MCIESREHCTPKSPGGRKHETPNLGSGTARDKGLDFFPGNGKLKGVTVKLRVIPNASGADIRNKEEYLYP